MVRINSNLRYLLLTFLVMVNQVSAFEISGYAGVESLGFFNNPIDSQQHNHYLSASIEPEFYHEWDEGMQSLLFVPFYRLSQHDDKRTHFDIRELTWDSQVDDCESKPSVKVRLKK